MKYSIFTLVLLITIAAITPANVSALEVDEQISSYMDEIHLYQGYKIATPNELDSDETRSNIERLEVSIEQFGIQLAAGTELTDSQLERAKDQLEQCLEAIDNLRGDSSELIVN